MVDVVVELEVEEVVELEVDEELDVELVVEVEVVVGTAPHAGSATPFLHFTLTVVALADRVHAEKIEQYVVSNPFDESVIRYAVRTVPVGCEPCDAMSRGTSPRLLAESLMSPGLMAVDFVAPPAGAVEFLYCALIGGLTTHFGGPAGHTNFPEVLGSVRLSYWTSSVTPIVVASAPPP